MFRPRVPLSSSRSLGRRLERLSRPRYEKKANRARGERRHKMTAVDAPRITSQPASPPIIIRLLRLGLAVLLLLPCFAITLLFMDQLMSGELLKLFHPRSASLPFVAGGVSVLLLLICRIFPSLFQRLYVFGHEATHALFVYLCFGEVREFRAGEEGGYIIANRSNIVVALAPYVFPFWSLVISLPFGVIGLFWQNPLIDLSYYWLLGATWFFNLWWTIQMIPLGQSDLHDNGTILSLVLIYGLNVLIISLLFEAASPQRDWAEWTYRLTNYFFDVLKIFT